MGRLTDLFDKRSVDDRLLSGELSFDSAEGKKRAEHLVSPHHRQKVAKGLQDLVAEAWRPRASFFNANLKLQRIPIRENQQLILTLALELEELPTVNPHGVLLADRLVTDGESPAYMTERILEDNGALVKAVKQAREALKSD